MSNVAALHPSGSDKINLQVSSKVPHLVGKSLELIPELTDGMSPDRGYDMSWISCQLSELGLGTRPSGEVWKGPMMSSNSAGE